MSSKAKFSRMATNATFLAGMVFLAADIQAAGPFAHGAAVREQAVSYADLNLSNQADVATLYTRLRAASKKVCGTYDIRDIAMRRLHEGCVAEALSVAVEQVGHSGLSALHNDSGARFHVAQKRRSAEPRI